MKNKPQTLDNFINKLHFIQEGLDDYILISLFLGKKRLGSLQADDPETAFLYRYYNHTYRIYFTPHKYLEVEEL